RRRAADLGAQGGSGDGSGRDGGAVRRRGTALRQCRDASEPPARAALPGGAAVRDVGPGNRRGGIRRAGSVSIQGTRGRTATRPRAQSVLLEEGPRREAAA